LDLIILKQDGRREVYDREKMVKGIKRSLEKRPITDAKFKKLINAVERDLQKLRKSEITSRQVGQVIMKQLKKVDQIAYIRFASVYESFKDVQTFQKELNKLIGNKKSSKE